MKKTLLWALALLIALLPCVSAPAEETAPEQDFAGIWADPAFDRMELVILPSEIAWPDERMGEDAGANRFAIVTSGRALVAFLGPGNHRLSPRRHGGRKRPQLRGRHARRIRL